MRPLGPTMRLSRPGADRWLVADVGVEEMLKQEFFVGGGQIEASGGLGNGIGSVPTLIGQPAYRFAQLLAFGLKFRHGQRR